MKAVYGIVITKDSSLNIRQSMGKDTKVVAKAPKDSKLRILEALGTWYKVQLDDGTIGYASSEYIQVLSKENIIYGIVATKNSPLNVRQEMTKASEVVAKLPKGSTLRILNTFDNWYEVQLDNGMTGYTSKEYVKVSVPTEKSETELKCSGKRYCSQMDSCTEAKFYLNTCELKNLDRDGDGIPCENICQSTLSKEDNREHKKPVILDAKVLSKTDEKGFFVALQVDAYELAKLTFRYSCDHPAFFSTGTKQCSPKELSGKIEAALSKSYYLNLYGKYRNRWLLFNNKSNYLPTSCQLSTYAKKMLN